MQSALEVTLRTQGEIWFASREVGRLADTEPYFLNTALYYAFGLASGRYVDRLFEPTYLDDTADVADKVYVTPATPTEGVTNRITSTYNTSTGDYATINYSAQDDPNEGRNLPSYGRRRVLGHGNELRCYVFGRGIDTDELRAELPGYVRLGKKRGKARVDTAPLAVDHGTGEYELGHAIGAYDSDQTPVGNLITKQMRPTPLIAQGAYDGPHVVLSNPTSEPEKRDTSDSSVKLPADVQFLRRKR
ncbi:type I-D CRISPR-associated protein Cas5/Csc1 [Haloarcula sp. S1CR25-12]|uniref:Type I-D CRISPR-associated protein Cas5/Csc1 n=1 Tax=Haloarcula saliterrae TaxID=2950534 RepID=A0ABU2FFF2_9EURY|nr:type I-D CRISPR-associated protein Cas5/Csc1 [Haloarcula sp. S1CR25-12]MDS0260545.1 type I-D CRISPR-associated protein Cas5/Csc1 [Haloarcula sp. S1CR25-12]